MKIAIAGDHAGYDLKQQLAAFLQQKGYEVADLGAETAQVPSDYPDFAEKIADVLKSGAAERGILVCGSGVGVCIAANKIDGVYAGLCHDTYSAHQGVEHDQMNVLCIGARIVGPELAREIALSFLQARFTGEERHLRRVNKIRALEHGDRID